MVLFFCSVRRALDGILRSLDHSVGRQLTSTNPQAGKSVEEILRSVNILYSAEKRTCLHICSAAKPKLDLLKTCVAAIPRILPENMNRDSLTDLLSRLTIHLDHELGRLVVCTVPSTAWQMWHATAGLLLTRSTSWSPTTLLGGMILCECLFSSCCVMFLTHVLWCWRPH